MTDFDDLFYKGEPQQNPNPIKDEPKADIQELFQEQRTNRILITIYFVVQILLAAVMMFKYNSEIPDPNYIINNIVVVTAPNLEVSDDATDPKYPYLVHVSGAVQNDTLIEIPKLIVTVNFYNDNEFVDSTNVSQDFIKSNGIMTIDETYYFASPVNKINFEYSLDLDTSFTVMLNFFQALILGVGFLFIDRYNFKKRLKEFTQNLSSSIGKIVIGSLMVYGAMLASQLILEFIGAADTSQNEITIASMFTNDPQRLFILFLLLCVFTPILEEVIYRKVIFGWLDRKFGAIAAIILSGAIFGLMHVISYGDFIQSIPYIFMGAVFGYVYHWSKKNIFVTIGVHFINNFLAFMIYFLAVMGITTI